MSGKVNDIQISKNFKLREFSCKHCGTVKIHPDLVKMVQRVRDYFGRPVIINSGYRCATHNKAVGGASNSQHLYGTAADIVVSGISPAKVADYCESFAMGLGRYKTFTHIDCRSTKSRWNG